MSKSPIQIEARKSLLRRGILPLIEQGEDLKTILNRLIQNLEGQADKMLAAIFFYDPLSNDLCVGAAPNLQPSYKKAVNGFKVGPKQPACGSSVFKRDRVICEDIRIDPQWSDLRTLAVSLQIISVWSEPIFDNNRNVLGTLAFYFPEPKKPDSSDLIVLETAAALAALAIQCRLDQFKEINRLQRISL